MSTYKKLTSKDVIITPFEVNKSFNFFPLANTFTASIGIDSFVGQNLTGSFNSSSDAKSGTDNLFRRLVYHSIKQLYYGNYLSGSNGFISNAATASFNTDGTIVGPVYTTNYNDFLESTIYATSNTAIGSGTYKSFPTVDMSRIGVISIPTKLYGDYIVPGTFQYDIPGSSSLDFDNPEFIQSINYTDALEDLSPGILNVDIEGVVYNNDGTKIFLLNNGNGSTISSSLFEFTLSTPYDISSYGSGKIITFNPSGASEFGLDANQPRGIKFNNDGTKFFIADGSDVTVPSSIGNDSVLEFNCSTPYDISTATYNPLGSKTFSTGIGDQLTDLTFNNDGSKLYICGFNKPTSTQSQINQYNLSPSYDITSSAAASSPDGVLVISVDGEDVNIRGIEFNNTGTLLLVVGDNLGSNINMLIYELTTPYDLNTAIQVGNENLSDINLSQAGISLSSNGLNLIFSQRSSANISQYSIKERILMKDDGQGNLYYVANNELCGNIFYSHGIVAITSNPSQTVPDYTWFGFFNKDNWISQSIDFTSSLTFYESQYKCTIRENEFNYSMNPTLLVSGGLDQIINGKATYQNFVTGSDFSPYITTVGLYDEDQNLLAVGKLAKPLPTSQTTDTTILINLDLN